MRYFAILVAFLLFGCTTRAPSQNIAETAKETISDIYKELPKECQTTEVEKLVTSAQAQIDTVILSCDTEKQVLENDIEKKNVLIAALLGIILLIGWLGFKK